MDDERTILISTHQVRDIDRILDHVVVTDSNRVLFNQAVSAILSRLRFMSTNNPRLISEAFYSQPSVGGSNIIVANNDNSDTEFNLESLFEFALSNPELLSSIFQNK